MARSREELWQELVWAGGVEAEAPAGDGSPAGVRVRVRAVRRGDGGRVLVVHDPLGGWQREVGLGQFPAGYRFWLDAGESRRAVRCGVLGKTHDEVRRSSWLPGLGIHCPALKRTNKALGFPER